jgi:hypothetical protein
MVGTDLFWKKNTVGWLLVAGLLWEKSQANGALGSLPAGGRHAVAYVGGAVPRCAEQAREVRRPRCDLSRRGGDSCGQHRWGPRRDRKERRESDEMERWAFSAPVRLRLVQVGQPSSLYGRLSTLRSSFFTIIQYKVYAHNTHAHTPLWIHVRKSYLYEHLRRTEHWQIWRFSKSPMAPRCRREHHLPLNA